MLTNKWILFILSSLMTLDGAAQTFNWISITNAQTAGAIVMGLGALGALLHALMPPASQTNITKTGGSIVTHTCLAVLGLALVVALLIGPSQAFAGSRAPLEAGAGFASALAFGLALLAFALVGALALGARRLSLALARAHRPALVAAAVAPAILLAGCDTQLTPAEQALVHQDLVIGCPILLNQLDPVIRADFNGNVAKLGLNNLELACPPNPEPTNIVVISADIIQAASSIVPYIPRLTKGSQNALGKVFGDANNIAAAHGQTPTPAK